MPHFDSASFETCPKTGNLVMTVDRDTANELRDAIASGELDYWRAMADLFEHAACNGSFTVSDAGDGNPFVGQTMRQFRAYVRAMVSEYHLAGMAVYQSSRPCANWKG